MKIGTVEILALMVVGPLTAGIVFIAVKLAVVLLRYLRARTAALEREKEPRACPDAVPPLPEQLKRRRAARGLSQEALAARLGVSRQAVSKWENGTSEPSTANLLALAALYEISVDELLRGGTERKA